MGETSTVTIDFRINSWLENAGIVGLTRILKANPRYRRSYKEKENTLEVDPKVFDNFSDLYFNFFIKSIIVCLLSLESAENISSKFLSSLLYSLPR